MFLRSLLRSTTTATSPTSPASSIYLIARHFAKSPLKPKVKHDGKNSKSKTASGASGEASSASHSKFDDDNDNFEFARSPLPPTYDPKLDVGPNGRPLFTFKDSFAPLTHKDACAYMDFSLEEWNKMLPEGLPPGMIKEFEETRRCAVMVRQSFLDLRDNFRRIADPTFLVGGKSLNLRKQIVLDGPVSCGKSIALAMLVHWARSEDWLVFYVPKGKEWTHGGFYYKNPHNDHWDTPVQASNALQDFLKFNEPRLQALTCQIYNPILLGEGTGVGMMKGVDSISMPDGSTLYDLIQTGISHSQASVAVLVRLRKELSLVKDVPVLFAVDQYNNWFTFSGYEEPVTIRSCRPIHARELSTVNVFRSMLHDDMMIGAFSHSTAVGKLREDLPDVPKNARVMFPRYSLNEAATVAHYYLRQKLIREENFSEDKWKKIYYLSNGNGSEMRWLSPFI